jgi:hypothetical protein
MKSSAHELLDHDGFPPSAAMPPIGWLIRIGISARPKTRITAANKKRTHHSGFPPNDVSNFFIEVFAELFSKSDRNSYYLQASSIATATATVIPTMGLLPAPMRPIIST